MLSHPPTNWRRKARPGIQARAGGASMPEATIQRAVVQRLQILARPGVVWFHPANGGARSKVEAARFRAEGVVAGVPDLIIVFGGKLHALELKTEHGRLSPAQRTMHERLAAAGAHVAVAYGLDAAIAQLTAWGLFR